MAKSVKPTNPNGANQYQLDPRQKLCWDSYINPKSETFGDVTNSARKAGYEESYCDTVSQSEWFCIKLWSLNSVNHSEKVFKEIFESDHFDPDSGKIDSGVLRIKADIAKFLAGTKGKDEGYSTRSELVGKDGKDLVPTQFNEEEQKALLSLLK
jgi:hypothetical protein